VLVDGLGALRHEHQTPSRPPRHAVVLNLRCGYGKEDKLVENLDLVVEM
jgi:hypothetical protein